MKRNIILLTLILIMACPDALKAQFEWPGSAKAAVCLTYDDGLDCHLDVAVPQLNEFGFKGTFFCPGHSESLYNRMDEWRKMVKQGHELGNHSLFHPCRSDLDGREWVKPEYDLNKYTPEQIAAELRTANTLLKAVDGKTERTYGYTCSDYTAGGVDFTGTIREIFVAARNDGPIPESMDGYDVYMAPSWCVDSHPAEALIGYVEKARGNGTIAIFMFHSVDGSYLNVSAEAHLKLLQYLKENEKDYYVATFKEVMEYIKTAQN